MAEKTLNTVIVLRNDSSTAWANSDVILKSGELGVSYLDNGNIVVKAGDGAHKFSELKQVEGVFEQPVTLTQNFGYFTGVPSGSYKTFAETQGMTTSEFLMAALKKTIEPTIESYPNISVSVSNIVTDTGTKEIGSKITSYKYTCSLSKAGNYDTNGKDTASGIKASDVTWSVTRGDDATTEKTAASDTYNVNIQIDKTGAITYETVYADGTLSLENVVSPQNNLGETSTTVKIKGFDAAGTTTKTVSAAVSVTGYRDSWYYVGTDCTTEITSDFIRSNGTAMGTSTPNFNIHTKTGAGTDYAGGCMAIPQGTKRIMFAVPGSKTKIEGIDIDGMQLPYDGFTSKVVAVKGANDFEAANYTVFIKENPNGLAATGYTIKIS